MTQSLPFANPTPFTPQQLAELETARRAMRPIKRAIFFAHTDGWSLAVFAVLSILIGLSSVTAILIGTALGIVAYVELSTIPKLKKLDPTAPKILAYNQLGLAAVLIIYASWNLLFPPTASSVMNSLGPELGGSAGDLSAIGGQVDSIFSMAVHLIYLALIAVAFLAQGSLAYAYYRRIGMIKAYLATTPEWIVQMQKAGFGL